MDSITLFVMLAFMMSTWLIGWALCIVAKEIIEEIASRKDIRRRLKRLCYRNGWKC